MTNELASAAQEWLTYALIFTVQLALVLVLRKPVRARFGAVACYRLWLLPLLWLPFYVAGPDLFAALASFLPAAPQDATSASPALQQLIDFQLLPFPLDPAGASELSAGGSPAFRKWTLLALILASGTCALIVWHGYRWLNFLRHVDALAAPLTEAERQRNGAAMDAFTGIPVVHLPCMNSAALFGVFKPMLLLPECFSERYDSGQRHIILAHEAVHLRRHDNAWNLLALLLIALFWFNPLLFLAWRCFRLDQELSCDALALARCNKEQQGRYARTLLASLAAGVPSTSPPALSAWNTLGDIKERSLMIKHHLHSAAQPIAALFSLLAFTVLGAALTITSAGLVSPAAVAAQPAPQVASQPAVQVPQSRQQDMQESAQGAQESQPAAQPDAQPVRQPQQPVQIAQRAQGSAEEARARAEAEQAERAAEEAQRAATREAEEAKAAAREAQEVALAAERTAREAEQAARDAQRVAEQAERTAREAEQAAREAAEAAEAAQRAGQESNALPAPPQPRSNRGQQGATQDIGAQTGRILSEAIRLLNEDRFEEARAQLANLRLNRLSPFERSRLHQLLFNLEMNDQDYPGAREQLQLALESGGLSEREQSQVRYQLAQLYVQEENYGAATAALEAWIAAEPAPNGAAYYLLAASYYYLGQFDRALPNAEKAIELAGEKGPQEGWLSLLAALYIEQKQFVEAEDIVSDMVGLYPEKEAYRKQLADLQQLNALR